MGNSPYNPQPWFALQEMLRIVPLYVLERFYPHAGIAPTTSSSLSYFLLALLSPHTLVEIAVDTHQCYRATNYLAPLLLLDGAVEHDQIGF